MTRSAAPSLRWHRTQQAERALWLESWDIADQMGIDVLDHIATVLEELGSAGRHDEATIWLALADMIIALCPPPGDGRLLH